MGVSSALLMAVAARPVLLCCLPAVRVGTELRVVGLRRTPRVGGAQ